MDTNNNHRFTNMSNWEPEMAVENHILHDHIPFDTFWPNNNLHNQYQHHHHHHHNNTLSFSSQLLQASSSTIICDQTVNNHFIEDQEEPEEELGAMKEMMFKIAAMQPVDIDPATIRKPKRRNVRISDDPQSVAARHRRERISEKMRILQRLVPGGTKMDTASMLDEAIRYVKFLKRQIRILQANHTPPVPSIGFATCPSVENHWVNNHIITTTASTTKAPLGSNASSSMVGTTCTNGGGGNRSADPMCLNNNQVIGD